MASLRVDMEGLNVLNKRTFQRVLWERRIMFFAMVVCLSCILLFVIAVATTSWAIFDLFEERLNVTLCLHLGIWGEWRTEKDPETGKTKTETWLRHFPEPPSGYPRLTAVDLQHYHRTQAVFSVIGLVLMVLGNGFALYSFNHHRYMYKRLTFGLLAFVAMSVLVVIEVLINSVNEWKSLHHDRHDDHHPDYYFQGMSYGYSTYVAWVVFAGYTFATLVFLVGGRKQKGDRAATTEFEEEDRPVNLS